MWLASWLKPQNATRTLKDDYYASN